MKKISKPDEADTSAWKWLEEMGLNDDGSKLYMLDMLIEMERKPEKKETLKKIKQEILYRISDDILLGVNENE